MATLDELLFQRQEMMAERTDLRQRMKAISRQIDTLLEEERARTLLSQFSEGDKALLTQTIKAEGIASEEVVNG